VDGGGDAVTVDAGPAHPLPALDQGALARFLHVGPAAVARWLDAGLPAQADGRIDPFAATNWLSAGRLAECPVMARRWRRYLDWFEPFLAGSDRPRRVRWQRRHRLYLPAPASSLIWFLAAPASHDGQQLIADGGIHAEGLEAQAEAGGVVLRGAAAAAPVALGSAELELRPRRVLSPGSPEHRELSELMIAVVGGFTYAYRHHRAWEYQGAHHGGALSARTTGSCIDCACALGAALSARGRRWRLHGGLVANTMIANPHAWIEAETVHGWAPLDPTLPAIVRMLGPGWGDWREYARAWCGGSDARRVEVAGASAALPIPGGATLGGGGGEAALRLDDGRWANAYSCIDWVCGDCEASFERC
jgi:hypothetical protein